MCSLCGSCERSRPTASRPTGPATARPQAPAGSSSQIVRRPRRTHDPATRDPTQPIRDADRHRSDASRAPAARRRAPARPPGRARPTRVTARHPPAGAGRRGAPAPPVHPVAAGRAAPAKKSWRSRFSRGRGLAVGALVVGLGLGAVGGSAAPGRPPTTTHAGTVADGTGGFDRDGDGGFGPPGGRGGMPPGGGQCPDGSPAGWRHHRSAARRRRHGTDGSTGGSTDGTGTDANGAAEAT